MAPDTVYYPDLMVVCGPPGNNAFYEEGPCLVIEALSPSTEAQDRWEKMRAYLSLETLQAYLLLDPERKGLVPPHPGLRQGGGPGKGARQASPRWSLENETRKKGLEGYFREGKGFSLKRYTSGQVPLPCLGMSLDLEAIYSALD